MKYPLRPYQVQGIADLTAGMRAGHSRLLLTMPTGTGKMVVAAEICARAARKGSVVVFAVHRRELVKQCSGKLTEMGVRHGLILPGEDYSNAEFCYAGSIQSIIAQSKRGQFDPSRVDVIVYDECHHLVSGQGMYSDLVKKYPKAKVIGLTATPTRSDGRGLGNFFTHMVQPITYAKAFEQGYLVVPKYFSHYLPEVAAGLQGIKIGVDRDFDPVELEKVMNKKEIIGDVIEHAARHAAGLQGIVFATRVSHSVALRDAFNSVGMTAIHIDGKTSNDERDELMTAFRNNEAQVLVNVGIVSEGVDVPNVGFVSNVRPTKSIIRHLQDTGRGLRPAEGKDCCLIFDHAGNVIRLGRVEDYEEWTLETSKGANAKKPKPKDPKEPVEITCEDCGLIFSSSKICPHCEHVHEWETIPEDLIVTPGELAEYHGKSIKQRKIKYTPEQKQDWYSQLYQYWHSTSYSEGWVARQYQEKFGVFPKGMERIRKPIGPEVTAFIEAGKRKYRAEQEAKKEAANPTPVRPPKPMPARAISTIPTGWDTDSMI